MLLKREVYYMPTLSLKNAIGEERRRFLVIFESYRIDIYAPNANALLHSLLNSCYAIVGVANLITFFLRYLFTMRVEVSLLLAPVELLDCTINCSCLHAVVVLLGG